MKKETKDWGVEKERYEERDQGLGGRSATVPHHTHL